MCVDSNLHQSRVQVDPFVTAAFRPCTQVNLDFESEKDMIDKFRVGLALQPIANALFANSPFKEGKPTGWVGTRNSGEGSRAVPVWYGRTACPTEGAQTRGGGRHSSGW